MADSVFSYRDYKKYLDEQSFSLFKGGRGFRQTFARAAGCQVAYISHVLSGNAHLSLEQAEAGSRYLGHLGEEREYFLLLVEYARAGTSSLRKFFESKIDLLQEQNRLIKRRIGVQDSISQEDQAIYYSAWYYAAIHVLLTIPALQTRLKISECLKLSPEKVKEGLDFLVSRGLAKEEAGRFSVGSVMIHLPKDSPLVSKHHTNWRVEAMKSLDRSQASDLHYSSVFTITESDADKIQRILTDGIEKAVGVVKAAKEERAFAITLDFFSLTA